MDTWDYYFGAIASIRFHPRNTEPSMIEEVKFAAEVADEMIKERNKRHASMG